MMRLFTAKCNEHSKPFQNGVLAFLLPWITSQAPSSYNHLNQSTNYKSKGETITILFTGRGVFKALQMLMEIENIHIQHLMWVPWKLWDKHVQVSTYRMKYCVKYHLFIHRISILNDNKFHWLFGPSDRKVRCFRAMVIQTHFETSIEITLNGDLQ